MWCQVQATSAISGQGCPLVRSKHAMCSASDGRIYLYGGKSLLNQTLRDLWRFDTNENCWEQMKTTRMNNDEMYNNNGKQNKSNRPSQLCQTCRTFSVDSEWNSNITTNANDSSSWNSINDGPPPLQEHTIIGYKNKLYVFGGEIGYSSDETPLWIFDLDRCVWKKFSTSSTHHNMNAVSRPLGRRGHSAVVYQNIMCIYGGYQDIKGSTSEIWTFNLDTEEWYLEGMNFKKDASPLARHGHSAVVYKDSMYVYGGMSNLNVRGDFWAWNFKNKEWNRVKTHKNPGILSFHSAIVVLDSMFIYGGERSNGNHTNELWRYRFANQTWEHIEIKGIAPSCRTRHVAIANPFLKELENNANKTHIVEWQQRTTKNNENHNKTQNKAKRHRNNINKQDNNHNETSFADSTESQDNIKSISMCFVNQKEKSPSIFSFNDDDCMAETVNRTNNIDTIDNNPMAILDNETDTDTFIKQLANSALLKDENNFSDQENNPNLLNNNHQPGNNDDTVRQVANQTTTTTTTTMVRMRPRRPQLQKQRPYSDFYGATTLQNDDFDFNELNETQFKRRSVQESMSYYSLCFSTPPAHLKQKTSPSIALISPAIGPIDPMIIQDTPTISNEQEKEQKKLNENPVTSTDENANHSGTNSTNQFTVKRRENFVSRRRLRKSDLLELSSLVPKEGFSTVYSLTLDISPDFEKELKFSTNSTPSNELNSCISSEHYEYESIEMTHLDMLEDYLEPEEMLEIVTESTSGEEISPSLNIKTIPRTPATRRKNNTDKNQNNKQNDRSKEQIQHQSSAASVSNSSSGYQSLILTDSNANSFEITSNPSISNSSSFGDQHQQENKKENDYLSVQKLVSKLNDSFTNKNDIHVNTFQLKQMNGLSLDIQTKHEQHRSKDETFKMKPIQEVNTTKTRSNHLNRLSHWEPNIKEVIEEVAIPGSPAIIHDSSFDVETEQSVQFNDAISLSLIDDTAYAPRQSIETATTTATNNKTSISIDQQKHPIFCMYVFGGKEDCITGVLNKQSMTIWKYYT